MNSELDICAMAKEYKSAGPSRKGPRIQYYPEDDENEVDIKDDAVDYGDEREPANMQLATIGMFLQNDGQYADRLQKDLRTAMEKVGSAGKRPWGLVFSKELELEWPPETKETPTILNFLEHNTNKLKEIEGELVRGPRSLALFTNAQEKKEKGISNVGGGNATGKFDGFLLCIPRTKQKGTLPSSRVRGSELHNGRDYFAEAYMLAETGKPDGLPLTVETIPVNVRDVFAVASAAFVYRLLRIHGTKGWQTRFWMVEEGFGNPEVTNPSIPGSYLWFGFHMSNRAGLRGVAESIYNTHREKHVRIMSSYFAPELYETLRLDRDPIVMQRKKDELLAQAKKEGVKLNARPPKKMPPFAVPLIMGFTMGKYRV
jgi:hypothetical protein